MLPVGYPLGPGWCLVPKRAYPRESTQNLPGLVFDSVHFGDNAPPFQGFAGPLVAEVLNDPGTWSFVPEPSYPILVGMIVLVVIRGIRKQRQSPRHADWPPAVRSSDAVEREAVLERP